ncbi:MAG: PD-(D/E)XK nuclease family protein, partial [Pyrinomonadaceae bacterium]
MSEAFPHYPYALHEYAKLGDTMHAFLEAAYNAGRDAALEWVYDTHPHMLEVFDQVPFDRLPPFDKAKYQPEVSLAYDTNTGKVRVLGHSLNRNEARAMAEPHEFVMTLDLTGVEDDAAISIDWKTGFKLVNPAQTNWQVRTGLLLACRALGLTRGRVAIVRVLWNGVVLPWEWVEMDEGDLLTHEAEFRLLLRKRARVLEAAAKGEPLPSPVVGDHCDYCPARLGCPAWLGLLRAAADVDELKKASPELLAQAVLNLQQTKKAVELAEACLKGIARANPIQLPNGDLYGEKLVTTETIVPERVKPVLEELHGAGIAEAVMETAVKEATTIPKDRFKSALRRHVLPTLGQKAKIGELERNTYAALREGRAVSV